MYRISPPTEGAMGGPGSPTPAAPMSAVWRRRTSRRRIWRLVTASYAVDVALVALFAAAGTVRWYVPAAYAAAAALVSATFYLMFRRPVSDADKADRYRTVPQMAAASAIQLAALALVPELAPLFLNVLFIVFAFAALRLTARQATVAAASVGVGLALVMTLVWDRVAIPNATPLEATILTLCYALTLVRCVVVGLYGSWLRDQLQKSNEQLAFFSERIDRMAHHDELTGAMNRRAIRSRLEDAAALATRGLDTLCVALMDIDRFKSINDRFGHAKGDEVLKEFVAILERETRATDAFGRYGGEEFLYVLSCAGADDAHRAMERMREAITTHDWARIADGLVVTVSIGIAAFHPAQSVADLILQADNALYEAKRQGRDRVVLAA